MGRDAGPAAKSGVPESHTCGTLARTPVPNGARTCPVITCGINESVPLPRTHLARTPGSRQLTHPSAQAAQARDFARPLLARWARVGSLAAPLGLALFKESLHPLLSVAFRRVVGHHSTGSLVGRYLIEGQLIVKGSLSDPHRQRTGSENGIGVLLDDGVEFADPTTRLTRPSSQARRCRSAGRSSTSRTPASRELPGREAPWVSCRTDRS